ncbi:hypothetical protein L1987_83884 [Smallanthus sonchifolius]|uniref:Uncharacterized protein n=1 Tax=Smallanthus sonchifolius TaxID=185202 RepID=A0ACB8YDV3_9ASTR|nr:hypothetical protein L1987_83884 [Smallanthus sonchifolius]
MFLSYKSGPFVVDDDDTIDPGSRKEELILINFIIRQRKLEVSKKFHQSNTNDSCKEDDEHVIDHSKSVETEASDQSEAAKKEKVSNVLNGDPQSDDVGMDGHDICEEQKVGNVCPQKDLDVESTPALRAPVDDTQGRRGALLASPTLTYFFSV